MTLTIRGPRGEVSSDTHTLDRNQAQLFRAGGKRTPPPVVGLQATIRALWNCAGAAICWM
jgi:hypothetical protein